MEKNPILSQRELTLLTANLLSVKAIFAFPKALFETGGNAAWMEVIFISLLAWGLTEISFLFYRFSGKKTLVEISGVLGGKPLKITVSVLLTAILSVNFVSETRMFSESVKLILLPKTEIEYIMILLATAIYFGQKGGISAIATVNAIFFPICLTFLGFIVVFLNRNYSITNLFPIFMSGPKSVLSGGLKNASCFSDIIAINLLLPHVKDIGAPKKSGRLALLTGAITMLLICLSYALCYPYPASKEYLLPVCQLTKMIRAGEYFQRFEAFFEFVWEISQLLYSAIYIFLICETLKKAFNLKDRKAIALPVITITSLLAAEPMPVTEVLTLSKAANRITTPAAYLLPILIPFLYMVKKRNKLPEGGAK